ncbi:LysR family transcriptional regulator [Tianweitania sediminis]|uniref:LysR family transcriptional regulator n=1 Tax=Tianweitania sediminis TaxID=1502156 RepID=A0A8J7RQ42_9HYPH|nr:LysR substrate-binding domain-containing protein [Tianweitania sediminis]MBP0439974.1 LysR family transcriptional regulator [Tianweitania sediminis]
MNDLRIDLLTLRIFLTVVDAGSIRTASDTLNLSPSAISRRLAELEHSFRQEFLVRHSRGMQLTESGQIIYEMARSVFDTCSRARRDLQRLKAGESGTVLLSANGSAFVDGLTDDMRVFNARYPQIRIELFEQISPNVATSVVAGRAELGLIARTFHLPVEIESFFYSSDRLWVAVPKQHPLVREESVTLAHIAQHPVIGVMESSSMTLLIRRAGTIANQAFTYRHIASTNETARLLVASGHGVAILPERFIIPYQEALDIVALPIHEEWAAREISIIRRKDTALSPPAELLFGFLLDAGIARG